jgi:hypothetical protein
VTRTAMAAPSFSSFPFASPGKSSQSSSKRAEEAKCEGNKDNHSGQSKRGKQKSHRDKKLRKVRKKEGWDEKRQVLEYSEEGRKAGSDGDYVVRQSEQDQPLFFSDRKGDALNIRYGRMADVPKYYLAGRKSLQSVTSGLMIVKEAGRYLDSGRLGMSFVEPMKVLKYPQGIT